MGDKKREISIATHGVTSGFEDAPAPGPIKENGQHSSYWVLSPEERAKGFKRPVRRSYRHVGKPGPKYPLLDLTEEQIEAHNGKEYVESNGLKFEAYPLDERPVLGRYWSREQLEEVGKGCGVVTSMSQDIAETYARDPHYYGSTFCVGCGKHIRVGPDGEFVWKDAPEERVGT